MSNEVMGLKSRDDDQAVAIRYKLRNLLGVPVDVLTPGALPDKFRQAVIAEARSV